MPIEILMPALSPTMTEGNLVKWLKNEGDKVKAGEIIAEIETDKATMEMEAVDGGTLGKILIPAGTENVPVNQLVALILENGESSDVLASYQPKASTAAQSVETAPSQNTATAATPSAVTPTVQSGRVAASPLAKRLAQTNQIDLATLQGSGPRGRIVEADVQAALSSPRKTTPITAPSLGTNTHRDVQLNNMRKVIAKRLTEAKRDIPHFYLTIDCQLDALLKLRSDVNARSEDQKFSVNDFVIRACALALAKVPEANATWHDTYIRQYDHADICVAVAIDGGLVTPIIPLTDQKSLRQISSEMRELAERARAGKLKPEEYQGGTFTLSNLGMFGIKQFGAILNPPQACILAVGMGEKRPIVKDDGSISAATLMTCTLSVDHRAVDGAIGARFLAAFKELIEDPLRLII